MKVLNVLLLVFISSNAISQVKISGQILSNKNVPLAGVSISIVDSYDGATSDSTGNFSFITSEKGSHILKATSSGFKSMKKKLTSHLRPFTSTFNLKKPSRN